MSIFVKLITSTTLTSGYGKGSPSTSFDMMMQNSLIFYLTLQCTRIGEDVDMPPICFPRFCHRWSTGWGWSLSLIWEQGCKRHIGKTWKELRAHLAIYCCMNTLQRDMGNEQLGLSWSLEDQRTVSDPLIIFAVWSHLCTILGIQMGI